MNAHEFFTEQLPSMVQAKLGEVSEWPVARRIKEADGCADVIAGGADTLFAHKKIHKDDLQPEQVRDAIIGGLAILAHRGSGVRFAGLHWCTAGHVGCPGIGRYGLPERTLSRQARGAYFTPRDLAEEVTFGAMEAVLYEPGPHSTNDRTLWRVLRSHEITTKWWSDIACGSGAFLLAGVRYYAERICEAWNVEAGLPADEPPTPAALMYAKRLAMDCMVGVDIDLLSVELSRIAVALLTPTVPVEFDSRIVAGDALLGITSWGHILTMSLDLTGVPAFSSAELHQMMLQVELAQIGASTGLVRVSDEGLALPFLLADLTVGHHLATAGDGKRALADAHAEARHWARRVYESPAAMPEARAKAREWLNAGLPEGNPPRTPLHWPLVFPQVFRYGAADFPATARKAA